MAQGNKTDPSRPVRTVPGVDGNACEENQIFGKYTPSGSINMSIHNPAALKPFEDAFKEKRPFYVDFTPADN